VFSKFCISFSWLLDRNRLTDHELSPSCYGPV